MLYLEIFSKGFLERYPTTGVIKPRYLDYLRRTNAYNKSLVVDYYQSRNFKVKDNHVLARFSEHLPRMTNSDMYQFIPVAEDRVESIGKILQFTSVTNKGIVHPPHFYGNSGSEIILNDGTWVTPQHVVDNWKDHICIETLTHNRNDLSYLLPFGYDDNARGGLSSVMLDGVALNIKLREFERNEEVKASKDDTNTVLLTKSAFIAKYVIPGMLESTIDHVYLNRVMDSFYGNEIVKSKHKVNVPIRIVETQTDKFIGDILDIITNKDMDFVTLMNNIPLMFKENTADLLSFDNMTMIRQVSWVYVISRLKYMCFLYDVAKNKDSSRNFIADWKRLITRMTNDRTIDTSLYTSDITKELNEYIYKIKNM